jgi:hypothetical protein
MWWVDGWVCRVEGGRMRLGGGYCGGGVVIWVGGPDRKVGVYLICNFEFKFGFLNL